MERRRLREEILARQLQKAHRIAANSRLSLTCQDAMKLTGSKPEYARHLHAACKGEEPPQGSGCLCLCHDVVTGGVETGTMTDLT